MWRHAGFVNPYGNEWFISGCQHQYSLGEAYETGYSDCLKEIIKYLGGGLDTAKVHRRIVEIEKCSQL